jgi:hypothetical protein
MNLIRKRRLPPIRLLINDVDVIVLEVEIPHMYRQCFHIPGTNCCMYCLFPLNYPYTILHKTVMFIMDVHGKVIRLCLKLLFTGGMPYYKYKERNYNGTKN